jgi:hypothetical protein
MYAHHFLLATKRSRLILYSPFHKVVVLSYYNECGLSKVGTYIILS